MKKYVSQNKDSNWKSKHFNYCARGQKTEWVTGLKELFWLDNIEDESKEHSAGKETADVGSVVGDIAIIDGIVAGTPYDGVCLHHFFCWIAYLYTIVLFFPFV